jgi:two-component system heavy metal sensor histidine kinase CusS
VYSSIPRSITGRLVALYALATLSILIASGAFLSSMLEFHLARQKTEFLADEVDSLKAIQQQHPQSVESLRDEIQVEASSGHFLHYYIRVSEEGRRLLETPGMAAILPEAAFEALPLLSADPVNGRRHTSPTGNSYLLVKVAAPVGEHQRVMQLAIDTSPDEALIEEYQRDAMIVVGLGTLFSTLAGMFIARRGLAPLRAVTAHIQRITATQLHERVGATRWPVELELLATAFDDMLSRLERSFERLSQFSADLAHELRTPINNLMGEAEVALTRSRSAAEYRQVLESSCEEFGHLSRIIDSLLFLARAENSETPIERVPLDARAEALQVCEFYADLADERGVNVSVVGAGTLLGDAILLRRAVSNLIANALNHTPAGGNVAVRVEATASHLDVLVQDDGCGVAPEHLPRLFERFYRVDSVRSRTDGSGLGLALVKSITELHDGSVDIESELGRGTTVRLRFPAAPAASNPAGRPLPKPAAQRV